LDVIASGPTAPDPTTFADALAVLARYSLLEHTPAAVLAHLRKGAAGELPETPKALPDNVTNVILANNAGSLAEAARGAGRRDSRVLWLGSSMGGETRGGAPARAGAARSIRADGVPLSPPVCLLCGGETTVALGAGHGKGGRNQEFVLAALCKL